jgi:hypothetical protein
MSLELYSPPWLSAISHIYVGRLRLQSKNGRVREASPTQRHPQWQNSRLVYILDITLSIC